MTLTDSRLVTVRCDAPGCVEGHEDYLTSARQVRAAIVHSCRASTAQE